MIERWRAGLWFSFEVLASLVLSIGLLVLLIIVLLALYYLAVNAHDIVGCLKTAT